jgi:transcriptional regulator PpsR
LLAFMKPTTLDPQRAVTRKDPGLPFERTAQGVAALPEADLRWLVAAPADLVLLIDGDGVLRDAVALDSPDLQAEAQAWMGSPWGDVVAEDSRDRIDSLLRGSWPPAGAETGLSDEPAPAAWRHVNFRGQQGEDLPMLACTVRLASPSPSVPGGRLRVVAYCRDMRPLAAMQQRLVDAQHSMERDYLRFRHAETRYRHLFAVSAEGMLVIDAATSRVVEANPAAAALLAPALGVTGAGAQAAQKLVGAAFPVGLDARSHDAVAAMLAMARGAGRADDVRCDSADGAELLMSATLFRQDAAAYFLVRVARAPAPVGAVELVTANAMLLKLAQSAPDCLVVTDLDGRVISANAAFVDLVQLATEEQVRGESLDRWLGRTGVDLSVLISNLRQRGAVRLFATTLRGAYGGSTEVEISATLVPHGKEAFLGFTIRDVGRRLSADARTRRDLPRSVGQLTELVGRVPLKDIVGETSDLIEQLCIEAALELTRDNRASAAEMLGLSRQSLYVKLRRYGLGDLGNDAEAIKPGIPE